VEKAGVYPSASFRDRYTPACGDETVGICLHIPIVKELEKVGFSFGKILQKWVDKLAQKRCLGKNPRNKNLDTRTNSDERWKK